MSGKPRTGTVERTTGETDVRVELTLEGSGTVDVKTGLPFLDHMLHALAFHGGLDLTLHAKGDLEVDDHHTVEDCGLALGMALDRALGDRAGIVRFASAYAPLDEALARSVIDISGRPHAEVDLALVREWLGDVACENLSHFFRSFAQTAGLTLHVDVLRGENDHHRAEAAFKATALALRSAVRVRGDGAAVPSTKGVL